MVISEDACSIGVVWYGMVWYSASSSITKTGVRYVYGMEMEMDERVWFMEWLWNGIGMEMRWKHIATRCPGFIRYT